MPMPSPQELAAALASYSPQQLGAMDHHSLLMARRGAGQEVQNKLAPYEHRAYAREATADNPFVMAPFLAAAIPAYQAKKLITGEGRSQPSLDHLVEGYKGLGEGLWSAFTNHIDNSRPGIFAALRAYAGGGD